MYNLINSLSIKFKYEKHKNRNTVKNNYEKKSVKNNCKNCEIS